MSSVSSFSEQQRLVTETGLASVNRQALSILPMRSSGCLVGGNKSGTAEFYLCLFFRDEDFFLLIGWMDWMDFFVKILIINL